ncbi:unnamed protein product [Prunus armeniaca]
MAMYWIENLPICSTDKAWVSYPLNKVEFGTLKPGNRGGPFFSSSLRFHHFFNHSLNCPHVIQSIDKMRISSIFWLVVFNPLSDFVWSGQNFLPMFFLIFEIWMIPSVCPPSVPVVVGKKVNSPSASPASRQGREWIGVRPSRSVGQHSWLLRQKCQGLTTWGH